MAEDGRIAVIGSNSFSGADFIDLLLEDKRYEVVGISRSPEKSAVFSPYRRHGEGRFTFFQMDLNVEMRKIMELLDSFKPQYVVNFAAQGEVASSWKHPEQWFQTNAVAVAALCNYLKDQEWLKRYIHISTPEVYGTCSGVVGEWAPLNPSTPYAASKAAGDLFLFTLVKSFQFPLIMIRSTNVYGAHQQLYRIIPRSVIYLKKGITIQLHGGGVAVKSFIHIRDVSRGELAAMKDGEPGTIYHLSPDRGYQVSDIVGRICEIMGRDFHSSTVSVADRRGQDSAYVIDSSRSRQNLGWKPEIPLGEGLQEVVRWIDDEWEEIRQLPIDYVHQT